MPFSMFEPPPIQSDFSENDIRTMNVGRRQLRTEWNDTIRPPDQPDKNWRLVLPFANTYENAFKSMCGGARAYCHRGKDDRLIIFLNGTAGDKEAPAEIVEWVEAIGKPVAMKDFLAISFALDYEREASDPTNPQTKIGALRSQAKPYAGSAATNKTKQAADELIELCIGFLKDMHCYASADCIVSMPPSYPAKTFNLPRYMVERIAPRWALRTSVST